MCNSNIICLIISLLGLLLLLLLLFSLYCLIHFIGNVTVNQEFVNCSPPPPAIQKYDYSIWLLALWVVRACVCDGTNQENNKTVLQWLNIPKKNMVECFRLVPLNFNFFNKHSTRHKDCNNNSGTLLEQKQSV